MLNIKAAFLVGAFLLVVSANPPKCKDCIGDSLMADIAVMNAHRLCSYNQDNLYLAMVKIANAGAIVTTLKDALVAANSLAKQKCKAIVPTETCDTREDQDVKFNCLMDVANELAVAICDQEMCHGKAIKTKKMPIATKFLKETNAYVASQSNC